MGKQNVEIRNWLEKKERYAVLEDGEGNEVIVQRFRDLKMKSYQDMKLIIIAEETQNEVHYAMPIRSMLYDALDYMEQVKQIGEKNRREKKLKNSAEFLSGLTKEDRLVPVLAICLYVGDDEWDGYTDLHGILDVSEGKYQVFQRYIPNYHINLVDAKELAKENQLKTDLQYIFGMLEYRKDKEKLREYINNHREYFQNVDTDAYYAAKALLGSDRPLKEFRQKGEKVDMCQALEDLYQEGCAKGREQGRKDKIKEQVHKKLEKGQSADEIAEALEEDVEEIQRLIAELK